MSRGGSPSVITGSQWEGLFLAPEGGQNDIVLSPLRGVEFLRSLSSFISLFPLRLTIGIIAVITCVYGLIERG